MPTVEAPEPNPPKKGDTAHRLKPLGPEGGLPGAGRSNDESELAESPEDGNPKLPGMPGSDDIESLDHAQESILGADDRRTYVKDRRSECDREI